MKKYALLLLLFMMLGGCGPWAKTKGAYNGNGFVVDLPEGWMRSRQADYLLITRDGVLLQSVVVYRTEVGSSFKNTKKKLTKGMMPQEAAEVILDNFASNQEYLNFQVIENKPAKINGLPAFKTVYTYKDKDGLRYKAMYYGIINNDSFYGIRYTAPIRYYFDNDSKIFEKIAGSFKVQ